MKRWAAQQKSLHGVNIPFSKLLEDKYRWITIKLMFAWFTVCFVYYGTMLLLPLILAQNFELSKSSSYLTILVVSSVELVAFKLSYVVMDYPSLGRKNTTRYAFFLCLVASTILFVFETGPVSLTILFILIKCGVTIAIMVHTLLMETLYPYTAEMYHTLLRSKAMGVTSLAGRLATILLGVIGVYALELMGGKLLYLIFMVVCLLSYIAMTAMPYDTLGRELDHH